MKSFLERLGRALQVSLHLASYALAGVLALLGLMIVVARFLSSDWSPAGIQWLTAGCLFVLSFLFYRNARRPTGKTDPALLPFVILGLVGLVIDREFGPKGGSPLLRIGVLVLGLVVWRRLGDRSKKRTDGIRLHPPLEDVRA